MYLEAARRQRSRDDADEVIGAGVLVDADALNVAVKHRLGRNGTQREATTKCISRVLLFQVVVMINSRSTATGCSLLDRLPPRLSIPISPCLRANTGTIRPSPENGILEVLWWLAVGKARLVVIGGDVRRRLVARDSVARPVAGDLPEPSA